MARSITPEEAQYVILTNLISFSTLWMNPNEDFFLEIPESYLPSNELLNENHPGYSEKGRVIPGAGMPFYMPNESDALIITEMGEKITEDLLVKRRKALLKLLKSKRLSPESIQLIKNKLPEVWHK